MVTPLDQSIELWEIIIHIGYYKKQMDLVEYKNLILTEVMGQFEMVNGCPLCQVFCNKRKIACGINQNENDDMYVYNCSGCPISKFHGKSLACVSIGDYYEFIRAVNCSYRSQDDYISYSNLRAGYFLASLMMFKKMGMDR